MTITLKEINNEREIIFEIKDFEGNADESVLENEKQNVVNEPLDWFYEGKNRIVFEKWLREKSQEIFIKLDGNVKYSSLIVAKIYALCQTLIKKGLKVNLERLPLEIKDILELSFKKTGNMPPLEVEDKGSFLENVGSFSVSAYKTLKNCLRFIKETNEAVINFFAGTATFRKKDFWFILEDCSYKAVPIIALVSFLVGLIIAFVGAIQLKTFGAGIYVASMVSIGMTRIMGAIMVGIVMAGRTGSSFAATLGTMQANEEVDALKTLGIKVSEYLVAPRVVAIVLVIGFLTLLADFLGIIGGSVVGILFLDISSSNYFNYAIKALSLNNILIGLVHSIVYGIIIGIAGCYEGIETGRDADSVGRATTLAVVNALIWMIVLTGIITVILEVLGL